MTTHRAGSDGQTSVHVAERASVEGALYFRTLPAPQVAAAERPAVATRTEEEEEEA